MVPQGNDTFECVVLDGLPSKVVSSTAWRLDLAVASAEEQFARARRAGVRRVEPEEMREARRALAWPCAGRSRTTI